MARKHRNIENEQTQRFKLAETLSEEFGEHYYPMTQFGECLIPFESGLDVLAKYSSRSGESKWFWGISKNEWEFLGKGDFVALIFENEIG